MADELKMVVVNGVRYRPEDAPKKTETEAKSRTTSNKARTASNKEG